MANFVASWWNFWTKCENELLVTLAIDSNLTIGVCTFTYLSFKKLQHEENGAFIFWLIFLAFSYWYFGFGIYYDDFIEKGTFFAFNHLKEWLYRWDTFFMHVMRLGILYMNFDMAPILKWREKECVMCTRSFKQYNIRSETHCICVCPNCSRPKQRCKDICQDTGYSTITYDQILSKLKCCWILALFGYFLHIGLILYFSGYIQREFGAATGAGWIGFLEWFETIGGFWKCVIGYCGMVAIAMSIFGGALLIKEFTGIDVFESNNDSTTAAQRRRETRANTLRAENERILRTQQVPQSRRLSDSIDEEDRKEAELKAKLEAEEKALKKAEMKAELRAKGLLAIEGLLKTKILQDLRTRLNTALKLWRTKNFTEAAKAFREAIPVTTELGQHQKTCSKDDKRVLLYAYAMSNLASKSLENVKEGYELLQELRSDDLVGQRRAGANGTEHEHFPAIVYGLTKYELALNKKTEIEKYMSECKYLVLIDGVSGICKSKLEEYFPELRALEVGGMLKNLKSKNRPKILGTCRYEECQKLHKNNQSILEWKAEICLEDLDFKGFYRLACTEKCHIDFHSWCWKHKKDQELRKDKDYLHDRCTTPDCEARIVKIIVIKDDPDKPIEIVDKRIPEKMLESWKLEIGQSDENASSSPDGHPSQYDQCNRPSFKGGQMPLTSFASCPSASPQPVSPLPTTNGADENRENCKKNVTKEPPVIIVDDSQQKVIDSQQKEIDSQQKEIDSQQKEIDSQQKAIDDLKRQIEQYKTNEKQMNRQIKAIKKEKEEEEGKLLGKLEEAKTTSKRLMDETKYLKTDIEQKAQKSVIYIDKLKKDMANNKNEIERNKTKAYLEKGAIIQDEAQSYLDFVTFINDNLLFETEELPKLIGNLTSRSTSIAQQGYNEGILQSLSKTPNYNNLKHEILNQPTFNTQATSNSVTTVKSSPTRSKTLIQQAIDGVMEIYPDLEGEEIHSMLMQIKQQNNGSFKNLTVKDITERVSELKDKNECVICFYDLSLEKKTKLTCGHEFHTNCVSTWFKENSSCPMCRKFEVNTAEYPEMPRRRAF